MKLESFDATNIKIERKHTPILHIISSGLCTFSVGFVKELKLKAYDQVKFHHDKENPGDWYVEVVNKDGFVLREKEFGRLSFNNAAIANKIFETIGHSENSGRLRLGEPLKHDGRTIYTLITACLKKVK